MTNMSDWNSWTNANAESSNVDVSTSMFTTLAYSNDTEQDVTDSYLKTLSTVAFYIQAIIVLLGIAGNLVVLISIIYFKQMHTVPNCFIANLAVTDIAFLVVIAITDVLEYASYAFGIPEIDIIAGPIRVYIQLGLGHTTCFMLTLLSLDRFAAIVYPLRSRPHRTVKNALIVSAVVWIICLAAVSVVFFVDLDFSISEAATEALRFTYILFVTMYALPLLVITACYIPILRVVLGNKMAAHQHDAKQDRRQKQKKLNVLRLVITIVLAFAICWGAWHGFNIWVAHGGPLKVGFHTSVSVLYATSILASFNSCLNPFLYAIANRSFLEKFKKCPCFSVTTTNHTVSQTASSSVQSI